MINQKHKNIEVMPKVINPHIIKFQAWADSHVNCPYLEEPLCDIYEFWMDVFSLAV